MEHICIFFDTRKDKFMKPSIAIILVNYNGFSDTVECIKSINEIYYDNYQIFVVDNESTLEPTNDELCFIKKNSNYIEEERNLGFSGGNNVGIKIAIEKGFDYVLLLNNDTIVEKDFLDILVDASISHPNAGIIGGKIKYFNEPNRIWFGGGFFDAKTGIADHEKYNMIDNDCDEIIRKISFMTGCLMLIPRRIIERVGYLDDSYFLYAEDADYSCRVIQAGMDILYCSRSVIYHKVSASTGALSDNTIYYMTRNNLYLVKKYGIKPKYIILKFMYKSAKDIFRKRKKALPVISGYLDFFWGVTGKRKSRRL